MDKNGIFLLQEMRHSSRYFSVMAMQICQRQTSHKGLDESIARNEDEEQDRDCFEPVSRCPACNRGYDVALILPCSHTMCRDCVAAGDKRGSPAGRPVTRGVDLPVPSVPCPRCRRAVELPCRTWWAAASCLPTHPTLSPARASGGAGVRTRQGEGYLQVRNSEEGV